MGSTVCRVVYQSGASTEHSMGVWEVSSTVIYARKAQSTASTGYSMVQKGSTESSMMHQGILSTVMYNREVVTPIDIDPCRQELAQLGG